MKSKLIILFFLSLASVAYLQVKPAIANSNYASFNQALPAESTKLIQQIESLQLQLNTYQLQPIKLSASQEAVVAAKSADFELTRHSPTAIISVIISGLCFLTASLLIYVK